jgi:hypothetical protein
MSAPKTIGNGFGLELVVVYCCTAWEGPGGSLAGLKYRCEIFGARYGLRVEAWNAEIVPDDVDARDTQLLRLAIDFAATTPNGRLLIAESTTLVSSRGRAVVLAQGSKLGIDRVVTVPDDPPRLLGP